MTLQTEGKMKHNLIRSNAYHFKENQLFHDGGPYHIETSLLICRANQLTGFCMIGTFAMKELTALSLMIIT